MSGDPTNPSAPTGSNIGVLTALAQASSAATPLQGLDPCQLEDIRDRRADRDLRKRFAGRWYWLAAAQLGVLNLLLILVGSNYLAFSDWLFHAYVVATFCQIVGIVTIVTRNLFPIRDKPA